MRVHAGPLRLLVAEIFRAAGCSGDEANRIALDLVLANLVGHDSHGVVRTQRYVEALRAGTVVADGSLETVVDGGAFVVVDGNHGFGQTIGPLACRLGIERASTHGVSVVGLRRSGHLGRIGRYAEMAAAANQVSLHFVNVASSTLVAPFGAVERRMGTNPVSIGMPMGDREPLILDFATSVVAEGKALVALNGGKPIPADALVTPEGMLTGDPAVLYGPTVPGRVPNPHNGEGALRAMGDHKGSGLALMCELLAGALIGSDTAGPPPKEHGNGMLSIYLDVAQVAPDDRAMVDAMTYVDWFVNARPTSADGEVLLPGEPERRRRAEREQNGIELPDASWRSIVETAESVGVAIPPV
ncbi:MAG: malate/lactate/ureidoglycolate dehydrogenase [Acidimicrobiia bacterium]|nr:malate/lactate/ureidoglycolate dehydrogenase [Acidimicrobiia bacterium]MDH5520826.1 malate/lactate/ureidoglycolate dehydrogenase [Acidimicrobiia bacterium]